MTVIYHTNIYWIATIVHIIGVLVVGVPELPFNNIRHTVFVLVQLLLANLRKSACPVWLTQSFHQ